MSRAHTIWASKLSRHARGLVVAAEEAEEGDGDHLPPVPEAGRVLRLAALLLVDQALVLDAERALVGNMRERIASKLSEADVALPDRREFLRLVEVANQIASSQADWDVKYDLIFSKDVLGRIRALDMVPDYCDPDTSYEEDVRALLVALNTSAEQMRQALGIDQQGD